MSPIQNFFFIASPLLAGTSVGSDVERPKIVGSKCRRIDTVEEGWRSALPQLTERNHANTMADGGRPTTDVASQPPIPPVYGCSKNAPNTATLCHFFAPSARLPGAAAGSVSRCGVMRSGQRCGRPGDPQAEWHRCSGECHRGGGPLYTMGRGSPASAALLQRQAHAAPEGGCPAGGARRVRGQHPIVLLEPGPSHRAQPVPISSLARIL
jgi:hypothetical protein